MQITGDNKRIAEKGVFKYSNLRIVAKPEYESLLKYQSNSIDEGKLKLITG